MFGKESENQVPVDRGGDPRATSILAQGCKLTGEVEIKGTFRIEGEFEGTIRNAETLVVGKTASVKGEIFTKNAIVGGKVVGNITAEDKLEIQAGSALEGDIKTRRFVIDEGAVFEGSCSMGKRQTATPERAGGSSSAPSTGSGSESQKKQTASS